MIPGAVVRRRYERSLAALSSVVGAVDFAYIVDNTETDFAYVATFKLGRITALSERHPAWAERALHPYIALVRDRENVARLATEYLELRKSSSISSSIEESPTVSDDVVRGRVVAIGTDHVAVAIHETHYSIVEFSGASELRPSLGDEIAVKPDRTCPLEISPGTGRYRGYRL